MMLFGAIMVKKYPILGIVDKLGITLILKET